MSAAEPIPSTDTTEQPATIIAIKGFNRDWSCGERGGEYFHQYALGETYVHDGKVKACESGFHAIEGHPLEVFRYYAPGLSRYAEVELSGTVSRHSEDSKIAAAQITVRAELHLPALIERAVKWVFDRARPEGETATGDRGAASATGYLGAASATGDRGAASATGDQGAASATGYLGAASATGDRGAASATGDRGAASATGYLGAASATGYRGAASATGDLGAASATGYQGAASATGYRGAASATGDQGAASATGKYGSAIASGIGGRVSGADGCALHLEERVEHYGHDDHGKILAVWSGIVGRDGIKPDTFYTLRDGKPVAV